MADQDPSIPPVPESQIIVHKRTRVSFVWFIPVVAAIVGAWIAVTRILNEGPEITITFQSAEGLEAGKTKIRYEGLDVGTITALRLADDRHHVVATAKMEPKTEALLAKDTQFWVVSARVSGLSITGLNTLLSGDYVGLELGHSAERTHHFTALTAPPVISSDTPGRFFLLKASDLGSVGLGAPLYFRRLRTGQVVSYELDPGGQFLNVRVFVQAPYDQYVNPNTRFWHASGVDMTVGAGGVHIQTQSFLSILTGGIAFETPANGPVLPPAETDTVFTLFHDRTTAFELPPRDPETYLLVFHQSVRGLAVGAPVQFDGVTIGSVTAINPQFNVQTYEFSVPVTISVDPVRYGVRFLGLPPGQDILTNHQPSMNTMVARGLRAQLRTGDLLSGTVYVSMDFYPGASPVTLDWSQNPVELPTRTGDIQSIQASLTSVLDKLNQIQFQEIGASVQKTMGDLDQTIVGAHGTLTNVDELLVNASQLVDPNSSVLLGQLGGTLKDAGKAANALRELADYLEQHPEALVRGKTKDAQ